MIGAVDCTHVAIVAPPTDDPVRPGLAYLNRKGFYSLNVQTVSNFFIFRSLKLFNYNTYILSRYVMQN